MKKLFVCLGLAGLMGINAMAASGKDEPEKSKKERKVSFVALPAFFYTPETSVGLGALVMPVFRFGTDSLTRASTIQSLACYTFNKQLILENRFNLFTEGNSYNISGEFSFYDFPIEYYGVGNDLDAENKESISYNMVFITARGLRRVAPALYTGLQYRYINLYNLGFKENSLIYQRPENEWNGGVNSGLGYVVVYDNRDNVISAHKGNYAEVSTFYNGGMLGSEFRYQRYLVDLRKYYAFNSRNILAMQATGIFNVGDVPFREMARLGGQYMMRGYYDGRYRDKSLMAVQAEYRKHLFWRVGVVGFAAVGDVSSSLSDFQMKEVKLTGGAGLRFTVKENDRVNIRIDYGIGKNSSGLYFGIGEVF